MFLCPLQLTVVVWYFYSGPKPAVTVILIDPRNWFEIDYVSDNTAYTENT